jgi:hypothetical protein
VVELPVVDPPAEPPVLVADVLALLLPVELVLPLPVELVPLLVALVVEPDVVPDAAVVVPLPELPELLVVLVVPAPDELALLVVLAADEVPGPEVVPVPPSTCPIVMLEQPANSPTNSPMPLNEIPEDVFLRSDLAMRERFPATRRTLHGAQHLFGHCGRPMA